MAVTVLKCQLDEDFDRRGSYKDGIAGHPVRWRVVTEEKDLVGPEVLMACIFGDLPPNSDRVPDYGDSYDFNDFSELAYASDFDCFLADNEGRNVWCIEVKYNAPPTGSGSKRDRQRKTKPDPLDWDPDYWLEYNEEQVPIEVATLLGVGIFFFTQPTIEQDPEGAAEQLGENLWFLTVQDYFPFINRGAAGPPIDVDHEPGPIVNTAGQQTIDPVTETEDKIILVGFRNYANAFQAILMNSAYKGKVNSLPFLGCPAGTWKFRLAYTERPQEKEVRLFNTNDEEIESELVTFYPTYVKLEYNEKGWDRFILNNGQSSFRQRGGLPIPDPRDDTGDTIMLFPARVMELDDEADQDNLTEADLVPTNASEPVNLTPNGYCVHEITDPDDPEYKKVFHLRYRHRLAVDFNTIPAFLELVNEYNVFVGP